MKKIFFIAFMVLFFCINSFATTVSFSTLWDPAQFLNCVNFEIIGICVKNTWHGPEIGLKIRHYIPSLLVETVKQPGQTLMPVVGSIVSKTATEALKSLIGVNATSGSITVPGQSNLQFNEVHVYNFPFKNLLGLYFGGLWCGGGTSGWNTASFFKYFSELDALEWRTGTLETLTHLPQISLNILCVSPYAPSSIGMGYWGPIYPRTGFVVHQNPVVGSAADVFRAVRNDWIGSTGGHIQITPILWQPTTNDKLEILYPHPSACFKIGTLPELWDKGEVSPNGEYLYLYWRRVECCVF